MGNKREKKRKLPFTLLSCGSHRLLQKDIILEVCKCDGWFDMILVQSCNDNGVYIIKLG